MRRRIRLRALVAAAVLAGATGCGSVTDVTGKVTYKGAPVAGGSITLVASTGEVFSATLGADGTFAIPAVPTGTAQVAVVGASPVSKNKPVATRGGDTAPGGRAMAGRGGGPAAEAAPPPPPPTQPAGPVLPAQYGDPKKSGLSATIKPGEPVNIDLK